MQKPSVKSERWNLSSRHYVCLKSSKNIFTWRESELKGIRRTGEWMSTIQSSSTGWGGRWRESGELPGHCPLNTWCSAQQQNHRTHEVWSFRDGTTNGPEQQQNRCASSHKAASSPTLQKAEIHSRRLKQMVCWTWRAAGLREAEDHLTDNKNSTLYTGAFTLQQTRWLLKRASKMKLS